LIKFVDTLYVLLPICLSVCHMGGSLSSVICDLVCTHSELQKILHLQ